MANLVGSPLNDTLNGTLEDDTLIGGAGNDSLAGDAGNDSLTGVNPDDPNLGRNEIDTLTGGLGEDIFVVGDRGKFYYADGNQATPGTTDYALITDFTPTLGDVIQLRGSASLYTLAPVDTLIPGLSGIGIFYNNSPGVPDELLAVVQGVPPGILNLTSSQFMYVSDTISGTTGNNNVVGTNGNDILIGVNPEDGNPGGNEIDTLSGGLGQDTFVVGDRDKFYYADGNQDTPGITDYALITDFTPTQGDVIQLRGSASLYTLAAVDTLIPGLSGIGIFYDNPPGAQDELLAVVQGVAPGTLNLTSSQFVYLSDTISGGLGDDSLTGTDSGDTLIAVAPDTLNPGRDEIDTFTGGAGQDTFVLGDANNVYYDDGIPSIFNPNLPTDYALIADFTPGEDTIQLQGGVNYRLGNVTLADLTSGIGIYVVNSSPLFADELIGIVQGTNLTPASLTINSGSPLTTIT